MIFSTLAFTAFAAAIVIQIVFLLLKEKKTDFISPFVLLAAALLQTADIVARSIQISFVAVTNMYESLLLFSALVGYVVFFYRMIAKNKALPFVVFGSSFVGFALAALASAPLLPKEVLPPIPALQSGWLVLHIMLAFIGEAFFVVGFIAALMYLATKNPEKRQNIDRVMYTSIAIGYPIFTAGALIFGAVWAHFAWGSFWSWDPKETWALITWLVYTLFLHSRFVKPLRGTGSAIISIVGFVVTIFTFIGVNFLLSGLHSYA